MTARGALREEVVEVLGDRVLAGRVLSDKQVLAAADALLPLIEARERAAGARALRDAADDMPFGYSHAAHLLRDRADRIEADQ